MTTSTFTSSAASLCPLCGQANQCAMAAGLPPEQCWCMRAKVNPAALAQVPQAQRGQVCICPACGQMPVPEIASEK